MSEHRFFRLAIAVWAAFSLTLAVLLTIKPGRSLFGLYSEASQQFWAGVVPAKEYSVGFYYLPASQILFTPITMISERVGGVALQLVSVALMTWAAWELTRLLAPTRMRYAFGIVLILLIPGVAGILRVVQLDALMWALTALAAGAIGRDRPWLAALALAFALAIKPTAVVAVLLMGAVWPQVGFRLAPMVVVVILLPFLFADWDYSLRLYQGLADRIGGAVQQPRNWQDVGNMLTSLGLVVPFVVMMAIRAAMAPATLGIAWVARRRLERPLAAFLAFAFAALYLLLFNPRTEGGGYAGLSLVAAPLAARMILIEGRTHRAAALIAVCALMGMTSLTPGAMAIFGVWLKPTLAILVSLFVLIPRALAPPLWDPLPVVPAFAADRKFPV